jgi:hypothetical protein
MNTSRKLGNHAQAMGTKTQALGSGILLAD